MTQALVRTFMVAAFTVLTAALALAQTTVNLPNGSQTTTFSAYVSEQALLAVPSGVTFNVTNARASTVASSASVAVSDMRLATATKQLKISLRANAPSFTPTMTLAPTWAAGDVTCEPATFSNNGTGASGSLSDTAYTVVATCAADVSACSTTDLVFTLAAKSTFKESGNHRLAITLKFESIGE